MHRADRHFEGNDSESAVSALFILYSKCSFGPVKVGWRGGRSICRGLLWRIFPSYGAACVSETKGIGVGRRMTFEMEKAGSHSFFRAVGTEREITVVRLDAAESLLRRGVRGITLERV